MYNHISDWFSIHGNNHANRKSYGGRLFCAKLSSSMLLRSSWNSALNSVITESGRYLEIQWNLHIQATVGTDKMQSSYTGGLYVQVQVYGWGPVKCGLYKQVVFRAALTVARWLWKLDTTNTCLIGVVIAAFHDFSVGWLRYMYIWIYISKVILFTWFIELYFDQNARKT